jgi:DNA-binding transcriptional regulator GbsR (MarR family)
MDSITSIYSRICLHPHTITQLHEELAYSRESIYKSIHELTILGLIEKVKQGRTNLILPSRGYGSRLMQDLFLKALEMDMDPKFLLEDAFILVIKHSKNPTLLSELMEETRLSYHSASKVLSLMEHWNLIEVLKRKPIEYRLRENNELIIIVKRILGIDEIRGNELFKKRILDGEIKIKK